MRNNNIMMIGLVILCVIYLTLCGVLYVLQDRLIFFPPRPDENVYNMTKTNQTEFTVMGKQLHGWKINVNPAAKKTVLYLGGNAEDVVYFNFEVTKYNIKQAITFNHPGYGKSQGEVSQRSLYQNALNVYDYILKEYQLEADDLVVVGRSLGSAVATYLAANRKVSALILITPFDSVENIAARQFKLFPVKFILKHRFATIDYITQVKNPILMLAAEQDEIISDSHLLNLQEVAGDKSRLIRYAGVGHNTIQNHPEYYAEINRFIN